MELPRSHLTGDVARFIPTRKKTLFACRFYLKLCFDYGYERHRSSETVKLLVKDPLRSFL